MGNLKKLASINLVGPTYNILLDKLKLRIIWGKSLGFGNYIKCNLNAFKLHLTQSLKYLLAEWDVYQDNKVIKLQFSGRKIPPVILAKGTVVRLWRSGNKQKIYLTILNFCILFLDYYWTRIHTGWVKPPVLNVGE